MVTEQTFTFQMPDGIWLKHTAEKGAPCRRAADCWKLRLTAPSTPALTSAIDTQNKGLICSQVISRKGSYPSPREEYLRAVDLWKQTIEE